MNNRGFGPPQGWRAIGGEMAPLVRETDWSKTSLGPIGGWSQSLKFASEMVLASAFPMTLRWGPDFVLLYNDAYRPILGDKHPWALGRPGREAWSEVWDQDRARSLGDPRGPHGRHLCRRQRPADPEAGRDLGRGPLHDRLQSRCGPDRTDRCGGCARYGQSKPHIR